MNKKNKILNMISFGLIIFFGSPIFAAADAGKAAAPAPATGVQLADTTKVEGINQGLDAAKNNNDKGVGSSLAGMAQHLSTAANLYAAYGASCSTSCKASLLAAAIAQMISGGKAGKQAGIHGMSNSALMPTLCSTSSSSCLNGYPKFEDCKSTDLKCLTEKSKQIPDLEIPDGILKSIDLPKEACKGNPTCLAAIPDENGDFAYNGKKMNTGGFNSAADLKNGLGFSDAQLSEMAKEDLLAAEEAKKLAASIKSLTTKGGSSGGFSDEFGVGSTAPQVLSVDDSKSAKRDPANLAGLSKKFRGENIGIAMDDIFQMMNRRYQLKDQQNSFMDPALNRP